MPNYAFEIRKWPKRHEFVLEECRAINVRQVLFRLPPYNAMNLVPWSPPEFPYLRLIPGRGGIQVKWWFQCNSCKRKIESLFIPPDGKSSDWKCRWCHNLIYASQRYGQRHPLRKRLTQRKKISRQKKMARQQRVFAQQERKQEKVQNKPEPFFNKEDIQTLVDLKKLVDSGGSITIGVDPSQFAKIPS